MPSTMIFVSWMTDWLNAAYDLMLDAVALGGRGCGSALPPPYTDNRS